jgi:glycosyltransferase involved in cell wall biosynthesis
MQENRILNNYLSMFKAAANRKKTAFWGHGRNLQDSPSSLGNKFKRLYINRVSWWFAYTKGVADIVKEYGFPPEKITVVNNAIDTTSLSEHLKITGSKQEIRRKLGIGTGPVGIYCGAMYKEKRLEFLYQTCLRLREMTGNFEMIFLGNGEESWKIKNLSEVHSWIHYFGPVFNSEKVPFFKAADVFLIPGLVGLAILDSFAMEVPLVTTNIPWHGPEIEYLRNGENGIITENTLENYTNGIMTVIGQPDFMKKMQSNCRESAKLYTVENMVSNFSDGILKALTI